MCILPLSSSRSCVKCHIFALYTVAGLIALSPKSDTILLTAVLSISLGFHRVVLLLEKSSIRKRNRRVPGTSDKEKEEISQFAIS